MALGINGTALSDNSITQDDYVTVTCTFGTTPDYAVATILSGGSVKGSKPFDINPGGTAGECQFNPHQIGTCNNGTVHISAWDGTLSAMDDALQLTVGSSQSGPETQLHSELLTALRGTVGITNNISAEKIDLTRDVDMIFDSSKMPHIYVIPDTTKSEWENVAQYRHNTNVGIVVIDKVYKKQYEDNLVNYVQNMANTLRDTISDYNWQKARQPTITEVRTGQRDSGEEELLYYCYMTAEFEVIA